MYEGEREDAEVARDAGAALEARIAAVERLAEARTTEGREALLAVACDRDADPVLGRAAGRAVAAMSYVRNRSFDEPANLFADEANLGHGEEMDRLAALHGRRPGEGHRADSEIWDDVRSGARSLPDVRVLGDDEGAAFADEVARAFVADRSCTWWWSCLRDDLEAETIVPDDAADWPERWALLIAQLPPAAAYLLVVTDDDADPAGVVEGPPDALGELVEGSDLFEFVVTSRDLTVAVFDTHHDELVVARRPAAAHPVEPEHFLRAGATMLSTETEQADARRRHDRGRLGPRPPR